MPDEDKGPKPAEEPKDTPPQGGEQKPADKPETFSREYVEELRRENAKYRTRANELEEKQQKAADDKLAEDGKFKDLAEKREAEIKQLRTEMQQGEIRAAVLLEASKAGIADPNDALKLADLSKVEVKDGGVSGAAEAVAALLKDKPYLKTADKTATPNIGATNPAGGPAITAKDIAKMSAAEIASMPEDDYKALMASLTKK